MTDKALAAAIEAGKMGKSFGSNQSMTPIRTNVGTIGDEIRRIIVVPTATGAQGNVQIRDGSMGTPMTLYTGGLATLTAPISLDVGLRSFNGGWYISTGVGVSVIVVGQFS